MSNSFEEAAQNQQQETPAEALRADGEKEGHKSEEEFSNQEKSAEGNVNKNKYAEIAEQHVEGVFASQKAELRKRQGRYEGAMELLKTKLAEAQKQYPQLENSEVLKTLTEDDKYIFQSFEAASSTLDLGKEAFLNKASQEFSGPADWMTDDIHIRGFERSLQWYGEWLQDVSLPAIDAIIESVEKKTKEITLALQRDSIEGGADGKKDPAREIEDQLTELYEGNFFTGGQKHLKLALRSYNRFAGIFPASGDTPTIEKSLPKAA